MIYEAINYKILPHIPKTANRLLDIGCGAGLLGKQIKKDIGCEIVGITYSKTEATQASKYLDEVIVSDLNILDTESLGKFDCVICSHILEHLYHPELFLRKLHINLYKESILIIALPNVLFWKQRLEFFKGKFKYTDGGLMDKTHFKFFDWDTAFELVTQSGFEVLTRVSDGSFPLPGLRNLLPSLAYSLDNIAVATKPGLFGHQFIIIAQII